MRRIVVTLSLLAVVAALVAGRQPGTGAHQGTPAAGEHPLVGSWEVLVAFEGEGPIEVTNLITFTDEGSILAASGGQLPSLPGVFATGMVLTEGHGAWAATGERTAEGTFRFLTLDQVGGIASTNTARMAVEVDPTGNALTGSFALDLVSPNGNSMGGGRGTLRAERIAVEPVATPAATPSAAGPTT